MDKFNPDGARDVLEPELPPGFEDALGRHPTRNSIVEQMWKDLSNWRAGKMTPEAAAIFEAKIIDAARSGDVTYVRRLLRVMELRLCPQHVPLTGADAAKRAFIRLYFNKSAIQNREWPTKQEVRKLAEKILEEGGCPLPVERHWPRIFAQAGLSELLSAIHGRARRRNT